MDAELSLPRDRKPQALLVIVALGATGLRDLMGRTVTIDAARRQPLQHDSAVTVLASYHPSAILRARDEGADRLREMLVADLRRTGSAAPNG